MESTEQIPQLSVTNFVATLRIPKASQVAPNQPALEAVCTLRSFSTYKEFFQIPLQWGIQNKQFKVPESQLQLLLGSCWAQMSFQGAAKQNSLVMAQAEQ